MLTIKGRHRSPPPPRLPVVTNRMTRDMKELRRINKRAEDKESILKNTRNDLQNPEQRATRERLSRMMKSNAKAIKKRSHAKVLSTSTAKKNVMALAVVKDIAVDALQESSAKQEEEKAEQHI